MGDVLILFRNSKKLKAFDKQLVENKIIFKKEKNNYQIFKYIIYQIVQIVTADTYFFLF